VFRSYLVAALRNLARNKLYAAINIVGLAVGFAAAIFIALFVRDELSFDRFWPDYQRVYMMSMELRLPGIAPWRMDAAPGTLPAILKPKVSANVVFGRIAEEDHVLRRGEVEANEEILCADPEFFSILRPVVVAGNLEEALRRPDGTVLTETLARKYFGDANPLGQTLELDRRYPLRVAAVIKDVPDSSHFAGKVFISGLAPFSALALFDSSPKPHPGISGNIALYIKLPPGATPTALQSRLPEAAQQFLQSIGSHAKDMKLIFSAIPIADVHLSPKSASGMKPRGNRTLLYAVSLIGALIVAVAGINFVILMTARAGRRAVEIGVRKASGAHFRDLSVQFIGESVIYCLLAMLMALALVELLLPALDDFLQRDIPLSYVYDPGFCGRVLLLVLATGVCAGFYPAVVLSRFRPASVLKGGSGHRISGGSVRQALVVCQFAVLITLILATVVVHRQVQYALNEGMRLNKDQALMIQTACVGAFAAEVRRLPGVRNVACSEDSPLHTHLSGSGARAANGRDITIFNVAVEPGFFELYGLKPLAGRFFSRERAAENSIKAEGDEFVGPVVINEAAVREFGFASPAAAIGQSILHSPGPHTTRADSSPIIGVVPDFPVTSVHDPVNATIFHTGTGLFLILSVKLTGERVPETLAQIDRLWKQLGEPYPIKRQFVERYVQDQYAADIRQGTMYTGFAFVALFIACLGLFGLSAFTAEQRTKEIGIRKAMGAGRGEMVRMLLWQFTRPVLWANLIAWPAGYYVMSRWLDGFAYRIDLQLWMFVAAGGVAVTIAWLTVSVHAFAVARARPVEALRYE
jgi:putative ABC transport system permease protein